MQNSSYECEGRFWHCVRNVKWYSDITCHINIILIYWNAQCILISNEEGDQMYRTILERNARNFESFCYLISDYQ